MERQPAERSQKPLIVITGVSGLIGSRLARAFAPNYSIAGLDVKPPFEEELPVDFIQTDVTDRESIRSALGQLRQRYGSGIASVLHLAAYYDFSGEPSPLYEQLTVEGTRNLLTLLQDEHMAVEQFVFSSTLLVMQPADGGEPLTEESPTRAEWDYPKSKLEAEEVIRLHRGMIPAVILRISGVYDEECHSLPIAQQISRIYERSLESRFFPGSAEHGQPFVHLDDLAECFVNAVGRRSQLDREEVFLIAEPDLMSYAELQERIGELIHGREWPTVRIPKAVAKAGAWVQNKLATEDEEPFIKPWMIDLADDHYPVDIARARTKLGWTPSRRLRDTLPAMIEALKQNPAEWYRKNKLPLPDDLDQKDEV